MLAPFTSVRAFFKSWGLYPGAVQSEEIIEDGLSPEVIGHGISERVYDKLIKEAAATIHSSSHKDYFAAFCRRSIDATDGSFYLGSETWNDLEEAWDDYVFKLR